MEKESTELIKSKEDTDFTDIVKNTFIKLYTKYGVSARITDIFNLIKDAFDFNDFDLLDFNISCNSELESYLIDRQIDWQKGKKINFNNIYKNLLNKGDFSKKEKILFETGKIEERLWAIFLLICNSDMMNNLINNNQ